MPTDLLCVAGLCLGFRHGFDLDHVTAIGDLVGTKVTVLANSAWPVSKNTVRVQSCALAFAYTGGHSVMVAVLGLGALLFCKTLPGWVDPVMEKVVGITLLLLGVWILVCVKRETKPKSRGMILLQAMSDSKERLLQRFQHRHLSRHAHGSSDYCNPRCAMVIGALHGVGAETGTQILLVTSMAGTSNVTGSLLMLLSFLLGLLISNIGLAFLISEGYLRSVLASNGSAVLNSVVASLSIIMGFLLVTGRTNCIPNF